LARILLIEDEPAVRRVVRRILEGAGHELLEASEGETGMRMLAEHRPDLVITDLFMPGQDGIVTVRRIRKEFPDVKVIVVSGGDSTGRLDLRRDAELLGAIASLGKPFAADDLLRTIQEALALPEE
jgi:CheY-like chemotaxis protein